MTKEATALFKALVACGKDHELDNNVSEGEGLYELLSKQPVTIICDKLAQKLEEQGQRVMQVRVGKVKQF